MPNYVWIASTKGSDDISFDRLADACKHVSHTVQRGHASRGGVAKRLVNPDNTLGRTVARIDIVRVFEHKSAALGCEFAISIVRESGRAVSFTRAYYIGADGNLSFFGTYQTNRTLCAIHDGAVMVFPQDIKESNVVGKISTQTFNNMLENVVQPMGAKASVVPLSDNLPLVNYLSDAGFDVSLYIRRREHSSSFYNDLAHSKPEGIVLPSPVVNVVEPAVLRGTMEHLIVRMVSSLVYFRLGNTPSSKLDSNETIAQIVKFAQNLTMAKCPNREPIYGFGVKCQLFNRADMNNTNDWYKHDLSITNRFINFVIDNDIALYVNDKLDFYVVRPEDEVLLKVGVF